MRNGLLWLMFTVLGVSGAAYDQFAEAPHDYWKRTPADRFSAIKEKLESGGLGWETGDEKGYLRGLLDLLEIPASSQLLAFSTTSLQSGLITPRNPRAIYFNEDTYIGFIPGGKVEVVSLDPDLGGIFYIFDIPRTGTARPDRSGRCMKCHAGAEMGWVPGLSLKSVIPGPNGGSLDAYRIDQTGHQIPLEERLGGWYVTGGETIGSHKGNLVGRYEQGELITEKVVPGERFDAGRYLGGESDVLTHLLFEHQVGFVNRVVEATYRARTHLYTGGGELTEEHSRELDGQAEILTRYLLFADEVALPEGGIAGSELFRRDFLEGRRPGRSGKALRDLELRTRLFRYRCSYMIYSVPFRGLPAEMKSRVYVRMKRALSVGEPDPEYGHLEAGEKQVIREILRETLDDLPPGW